VAEICHQLTQLQAQNFTAYLEVTNLAVKHLVAENVLLMDGFVTSQYKLMKTAISNYVSEKCVAD
jgi:hypothetical protein